MNLTKASAKIHKTTIEEWTDSEDSSTYKPGPDDDMWDMDTVSDSSEGGECLSKDAFHIAFQDEQYLDAESDKEGSEFDEADIADDAWLFTFSNVLAQVQAAAVEAEKRADASRKRQKSYRGNSRRSQCCFCANCKAITARGKQAFISSWLTMNQKAQTNHNEKTRDNIPPLPPAPTSVGEPMSICN